MAELDVSAGLHHLAIGSTDVERLAEFYRDVFQLRESARHLDAHGQLRSIWLNLGGTLLMLERTLSVAPPVQGVGPGIFLLALRVSPSERARLELELESRGHEIEARTQFTSYTRDVDGNRVAFSHYPEP